MLNAPVLCGRFPGAAAKKTKQGRLPLDLALMCLDGDGDEDAIELLTKAYPEALARTVPL